MSQGKSFAAIIMIGTLPSSKLSDTVETVCQCDSFCKKKKKKKKARDEPTQPREFCRHRQAAILPLGVSLHSPLHNIAAARL
ncbi:hypothetical protein F5Y15DRAFT_268938 [Xylariaceae sp. FL0016]|nr:hypothetical protein F5Y15DRAFT_268938 [Xylariaceae sp. FL0016]